MRSVAVVTLAVSLIAADSGAPSAQDFESYVGFSSDGLAFAYGVRVPGGVRVRWLSATTSTLERTAPVDTDDQRREALADLVDDGFPTPGTTPAVPRQVTAELRKGEVVVLFGRIPACRPFKPFAYEIAVTPEAATVVAASPDGKRVAVRVTGRIGKTGAAPSEYRVFTLFE